MPKGRCVFTYQVMLYHSTYNSGEVVVVSERLPVRFRSEVAAKKAVAMLERNAISSSNEVCQYYCGLWWGTEVPRRRYVYQNGKEVEVTEEKV